MKYQKTLALTLALALSAAALTGCAAPEIPEPTQAAANVAAEAPDTQPAPPAVSLEEVELSLPENITRQSQSPTQDYLYENGQLVGGIALVDLRVEADAEKQDESMMAVLDSCSQIATALTKEAFPADYDYDYMAGSSTFCEAEVQVITKERREFVHYFFSGPKGGLDIWMDAAVLDGRDMEELAAALKAEGLVTPKEVVPQPELPILELNVTMPEGYIAIPATTSSISFYAGDYSSYSTGVDVIGGIIHTGLNYSDLGQGEGDVLADYVHTLAPEPLVSEYVAMGADGSYSMTMKVTDPESGKVTNSAHFFFEMNGECFDLWLDDDATTEEQKAVLTEEIQIEPR